MRYFFNDAETGGLTPKQSLLTYYGAVTDENFDIIDEIDLKIRPKDGIYRVEAAALAVNKIDIIEHDKTALPIADCQKQFRDFLLKHTKFKSEKLHPAGHNGYYDNAFVSKHLLPDFDHFFSRHCIDTACLAVLLKGMGRLPKDMKISLGSLAEHYGISFLTHAHDAKSDVRVTIAVLKCMLNDLTSRKE